MNSNSRNTFKNMNLNTVNWCFICSKTFINNRNVPYMKYCNNCYFEKKGIPKGKCYINVKKLKFI